MTASNKSKMLYVETRRMLVWGLVGSGIAAALGVWAGLWFGGYQAFKHDEVARFWSSFSAYVAVAAVSGAVTGVLAFFANGTNPFASAENAAESAPRVQR